MQTNDGVNDYRIGKTKSIACVPTLQVSKLVKLNILRTGWPGAVLMCFGS